MKSTSDNDICKVKTNNEVKEKEEKRRKYICNWFSKENGIIQYNTTNYLLFKKQSATRTFMIVHLNIGYIQRWWNNELLLHRLTKFGK